MHMKKNIINAVTGLIIGSFFMFLTFRNKPVDEVIDLISTARLGWIGLSIIALLAVFFLRALRWRLLIINSGEHPLFKDVAYSLLLGFFINSFTPKLGEIVRCTSLQKASGVEAPKCFGTVISERIYDLLALVAGILIITIAEYKRLGSLLSGSLKSLTGSWHKQGITWTLIILALVLLVAILARLSARSSFAIKVRNTLKGIFSGLRMTFRIRRSGIFIFQTLLIWAVMIVMNYCCIKALPSTENLSFYFAAVALFIGTIGWAIPSPGGMGTSHFFILQLFILFNLSPETGLAYGVLVNGLTIFITIFFGLAAIIIVNFLSYISSRVKSE